MLNEDENRAAQAVHRQYAAAVRRITADDHLSLRGRKASLARLALSTGSRLSQLRAASDARDAQYAVGLDAYLFGVAPDPDAYTIMRSRDADAAVAAIKTPGDARRALVQAGRRHDDIMARAVFTECWERGSDQVAGAAWRDIAGEYLAARPDEREAAAELARLLDGPARQDEIMDAQLTKVWLPDELRGERLDVLAAERTDDAAGDAA
jgi:hypothetical protein